MPEGDRRDGFAEPSHAAVAMTRLTLHGVALYAEGTLPTPGQEAPRFSLANAALQDVGLDHFGRCLKLLHTVPSLELPSCAASALQCEEQLRAWPDLALLVVSADLPFRRRLGAAGSRRAVELSCFRSPSFARAYGVDIVSGPLKGLLAPALLVLDERHRVLHAQLVREISAAPDLAPALAAVRGAAARDGATPVA